MFAAPGVMGFKAIVCNYDGTLTASGRLEPGVVEALRGARAAGVRPVLVTGRPFFELTRACQQLDLFDAVVAESGGVLYLPAHDVIRELGPAPPAALLAELDRRAVPVQVGRVVVVARRGEEPRVRAALAATGARLEVGFNRDWMILTPAGVSKADGVREVVRDLGLSLHDVLVVADGENDAPLLEIAGLAAVPADAAATAGARADLRLPPGGSDALGPALTALLAGEPRLASGRHRLPVGWAVETAEVVTVPAVGASLLIQGDSLSGKSWLAGGLVERLLERRYGVCVIDPEGDYRVLAELPGVTWVQATGPAAWPGVQAVLGRDPGAGVVVDLSRLAHGSKVAAIEAGLLELRDLRRRLGTPHWIVLDEAHYSLHEGGVTPDALQTGDTGLCLVTWRGSWVRRSLLEGVRVCLLAQVTDTEELAFLRRLVGAGAGAAVVKTLPALPRGRFVLVDRDPRSPDNVLTFVAMPRRTGHVRHRRKYADAPVEPQQGFVFRRPDGTQVAIAETLASFAGAVARVEEPVLAFHARRRDLSRWLLDVFGDQDLASLVRKLETRWRRGEGRDLRAGILQALGIRYGLGSEAAAGPGGEEAR